MNKFIIAKQAVKFVSTTGVSTIATNIIKHTLPRDANRWNKGLVWMGGLVINTIINDHISEYVDKKLVELDDRFLDEPDIEIVGEEDGKEINLVFDSHEEAETVLAKIFNVTNVAATVTLAGIKNMMGENRTETDDWLYSIGDPTGATIEKTRDGKWMVTNLPKAKRV